MTREEAIRELWAAATTYWPSPEHMRDSSVAYEGAPIRGKELYEIGLALGLIEEES